MGAPRDLILVSSGASETQRPVGGLAGVEMERLVATRAWLPGDRDVWAGVQGFIVSPDMASRGVARMLSVRGERVEPNLYIGDGDTLRAAREQARLVLEILGGEHPDETVLAIASDRFVEATEAELRQLPEDTDFTGSIPAGAVVGFSRQGIDGTLSDERFVSIIHAHPWVAPIDSGWESL